MKFAGEGLSGPSGGGIFAEDAEKKRLLSTRGRCLFWGEWDGCGAEGEREEGGECGARGAQAGEEMRARERLEGDGGGDLAERTTRACEWTGERRGSCAGAAGWGDQGPAERGRSSGSDGESESSSEEERVGSLRREDDEDEDDEDDDAEEEEEEEDDDDVRCCLDEDRLEKYGES